MIDVKATPAISVIIPAYKTADMIAETLDSLLEQTRTDWEAIIIDDASPDDILGAVTPFLEDSRFSYLRLEQNGGLAHARNEGLRHARGRYVCLLDSDDSYLPTYIEEMSARLDADSGVCLVCCDAVMFGSPDREGRRFSEFESMVPPVTLARVLTRDFHVFGSVMARTDIIRAAGGFCETLRCVEDFDLWLRLLIAGEQFGCVNKPLLRYRRRAGSLSQSPEKMLDALYDVYRRAGQALGRDHPLASLVRQQESHTRAALDRWLALECLRRDRAIEARPFLVRGMAGGKYLWLRVQWLLSLIAPRLAHKAQLWRDRHASPLSRMAMSDPDEPL